MTRSSGTRTAAAVLGTLLVAIVSIVDGAAQRGGMDPRTSAATMPLVGWSDLETWSRDTGSDDTEIGLGLQLTGPGGQVGAAFSVVRRRSAPNARPQEVVLTLVPQYDPTRVRFTNVWFIATRIEKDSKKDQKLDFSSRMVTYPPAPYAPGDGPVSARVSLKPDEFVPIAEADEVAGNILNVGFSFRQDQTKAVRAFAERVGLVSPR